MNALEKKIRAAKKEGRLALIPFITADFPDPARFREALLELDEAGADIIEIGVPFSDPVADGPVVEAASNRALAAGASLASILESLKKIRPQIKAEIVLMGYMNPFFQYGFERLAKDAAGAGAAGLIIPDLQLDEAESFQKLLAAEGLALIPLVGPNTPLERMREYAKDAAGYVYVVSVMGVTGERKSVAAYVADTIDRARKAFDIPLALGFGLKEPAQLDILPEKSRPDAAVFGSALLTHLDKGGSARDFMAAWK